MATKTGKLDPVWITTDEGDKILLASTAEEASAMWTDSFGEPTEAKPDGWMMDVGWDRDLYTLKREFLAESGFTTWWEKHYAEHDAHEESKSHRRAWKPIPAPSDAPSRTEKT